MTLRKSGLALATAALVFIAVMTLEPRPQDEDAMAKVPPTCLVCGEHGGVDVVLNLILFMPLGAGLALAGLRFRTVILLGLATTIGIEALQVFVIPGRDASLSDLLTNTLGAGVGAIVAAHWRGWFRPEPRGATRVIAAWGALWLGQATLAGWALQLDLPNRPWYGQHAAELGQFDQFTGDLVEARLNGAPVPSGRMEEASAAPIRSAQDVVLRATSTVGTPTGRVAPIVSIFDDHQDEVTVLGRRADDLVFRARLRAALLRLRVPAIELPEAFRGLGPGDTIHVSGRIADGVIGVRLDSPAAERHQVVALSPQLGWALLLPYDHPLGPEARLLTLCWIAALVLPLGWWAGSTAPPAAGRVLVLAVVVAGLLGVPLLTGHPPGPPGHWWAALLGLLAGVLLHRAASGPRRSRG